MGATVASGWRFGGIATRVRQSFTADAQLAVAPNFGAVNPTPWAGRAQPGVVSPSAPAPAPEAELRVPWELDLGPQHACP
eukprot:COSAG02_NODE_3266_length_7057_cov_12.370078_3_plen_80_part_00